MPPPHRKKTDPSDALVPVALLAGRWIERLLAGHEPPMTVSQFLALRAIDSEGVSGGELARRTGVSGPAVSQLLTSLAETGLLSRHELADDRRRLVLTLTSEGKRVLASAQSLLRQQLSSLLVELPRPEADALSRALPKVEAALSGAPPPRRPHPGPRRPHPPPRPPRGPRA